MYGTRSVWSSEPCSPVLWYCSVGWWQVVLPKVFEWFCFILFCFVLGLSRCDRVRAFQWGHITTTPRQSEDELFELKCHSCTYYPQPTDKRFLSGSQRTTGTISQSCIQVFFFYTPTCADTLLVPPQREQFVVSVVVAVLIISLRCCTFFLFFIFWFSALLLFSG